VTSSGKLFQTFDWEHVRISALRPPGDNIPARRTNVFASARGDKTRCGFLPSYLGHFSIFDYLPLCVRGLEQ